jgi:uncharacterized protein
MATYFCDSSAVIKCYVTEIGSGWMNSLTDPAAGHLLTISRITTVEVPVGLARRKREASISDSLFRDGLKAFRRAYHLQYQLIEIDSTISDVAQELIVRHPLRATMPYNLLLP